MDIREVSSHNLDNLLDDDDIILGEDGLVVEKLMLSKTRRGHLKGREEHEPTPCSILRDEDSIFCDSPELLDSSDRESKGK